MNEIMHGTVRLPLDIQNAGMPEAISVMTSSCFGLADFTDDTGALVGIINVHKLLAKGCIDRHATHECAILIPARYASTRNPAKPLAQLRGADGLACSLIEHSWLAATADAAPVRA